MTKDRNFFPTLWHLFCFDRFPDSARPILFSIPFLSPLRAHIIGSEIRHSFRQDRTMADQQLACVYAAFLLQESKKKDADSIVAVCNAAGVKVAPGVSKAFASILAKSDVSGILSHVTLGGGAAAPAAAPKEEAKKEDKKGADKKEDKKGGDKKKEEKKKEEPAPEEDDGGMLGLFD